jgi:KDO2-lipid IV(A) lauroyltransferase
MARGRASAGSQGVLASAPQGEGAELQAGEADETARVPAPRRRRGPPHPALIRLEYWGFRIVAAIFRALPLETASAVSGWIWRHVAPLLRRHRRALAHLEAAIPGLAPAERERIIRDMWEVLGRTFGEAFQLDRILAEPDRLVLAFGPDVEDLLNRHTALVVVSLHMGNWEITAMGGTQAGLTFAGVYQKLKNPLVDAYVTAMRGPFYPAGLFSKGRDTVLKLMRLVRGGVSVAILADLRDWRGVAVPFFGRLAPSTPFPALLGVSQDLPIIAVRVLRKPGVRFVIDGEVIPVQRTGDRDADVTATTAAIQACFERWIRQTPDQWMWAHRRWG